LRLDSSHRCSPNRGGLSLSYGHIIPPSSGIPCVRARSPQQPTHTQAKRRRHSAVPWPRDRHATRSQATWRIGAKGFVQVQIGIREDRHGPMSSPDPHPDPLPFENSPSRQTDAGCTEHGYEGATPDLRPHPSPQVACRSSPRPHLTETGRGAACSAEKRGREASAVGGGGLQEGAFLPRKRSSIVYGLRPGRLCLGGSRQRPIPEFFSGTMLNQIETSSGTA
jgi:hypothetical protein